MSDHRIRVGLVHRDATRMVDRTIGWWSYNVPQFDLVHLPVDRGFEILLSWARQDDIDLLLYEDGKLWGTIIRDAKVPVAYQVIDSNLTAPHYQLRLQQGQMADLLLVDYDRLDRFDRLAKRGIHIRRWGYCVNDQVMLDWALPKTVDVGFYCNVKRCDTRAALLADLADWCAKHGLTFAGGPVADRWDYAKAFNRTKINVAMSRPCTWPGRMHRVFDVMACRSCLLTDPLPDVTGEHRILGQHYLQYHSVSDLKRQILQLLDSGAWQQVADQGFALAHSRYTWAVRAAQLTKILHSTLGIGG